MLSSEALALVDLNVRIDAPNEEKFLFGWHQDYWFSICSPNALVAWIPLVELSPETGGISIISNRFTGERIFKVRPSETYHSYSNSILLDEMIPESRSINVFPPLGGCALFKFNVLHKSMANTSLR